MGWLSYRNNVRVLEEKIAQGLDSITSQTSREIDLWLKERQYEIKVFASSYEVAENLERISGERAAPADKQLPLSRLGDYLKSVEGRFPDYNELAVLDLNGAVVATSEPSASVLELPPGWKESIRSEGLVVGAPYWNPKGMATAMILAEPVRGSRGTLLGLLAARVNLKGVDAILRKQAAEGSDQILVITRGGMILSSHPPIAAPASPVVLRPQETTRLFSGKARLLQFENVRGQEVVGALRTAQRLDWGVVAEKNRATEYEEIGRVRNATVVLMVSMLIGIGLAAYILGLTLVVPLNRLIRGAGKVAGGNLDIDLPVSIGGEVGYLTVVFNHMVARLRTAREEIEATNKTLLEKNEELHEISITDGLTGLHNRKHMNETVASELARADRHGHPVSILMMDIDHFKNFNDSLGHQAGDGVLIGLAALLKETLRGTDYGARYGGEEFLVLLPHVDLDEAIKTAERIRGRIETAALGTHADGTAITVSIGVASFPASAKGGEKVIREADLALYEAKRTGRNRVVASGASTLAPRPPRS